MADKLTIKQEKFVQGLFAGLSQREAYKQAFDCKKMKNETKDKRACELAKLGKVKGRLKEITDELASKNMLTVQKVIDELSHIAFDDISNYLDYRTEKTVVGYDITSRLPIIDYRTIVDLKDSTTIDTRSIAEVSIGPNGTFKFKQYCKDNALVQLGKHLGMFVEKVEHSGSIDVDIENLPDDELERRIKDIAERLLHG